MKKFIRANTTITGGLLAASVLGLAAGGVAWLADARTVADALWAATTVFMFVPATFSLLKELWKRKSGGVDIIALLAMGGALALGEYLAGAVIALMLATGRALEEYAANRAERELSALLERAPRVAHRLVGGTLTSIPVDEVVAGDILVVKDGDILPVDGVVTQGPVVLDESALTGESRLVERGVREEVRSGAVNAGSSFQMRAISTAAESTYAGIIRMVEEAQKSKAPLVRLADRYAQYFVPLTLAVSALAWAISGSPVRALAVLVVATPCPLLLAAPIAIVSGVSRAARRGIVVKGGAAIETLGRAEALYLDKTGTLTLGAPVMERVLLIGTEFGENELVRIAASLDQLSSHVLAAAVVRAARERDLPLALPHDVSEKAGAGIEGVVEGREVRLGTFAYVAGSGETTVEARRFKRRAMRDGGSAMFISIDGQLTGAMVFEDPIRPDAPRVIRLLKRLGIRDVVMLTGDHTMVAESVGAALGVDHVQAGLAPEDKVDAVREGSRGRVTLMVGDGINDAPALAAADVGIAMGARGATSSSEAADVVLVVDRLDRLVEAVQIAQRSRSIALQSIMVGMALSFVAMGFAAFGFLPPVAGALLQEGIDAVAILNALRALSGGREATRLRPLPDGMAAALREEHVQLVPQVDELRALADSMDALTPTEMTNELRQAQETVAAIVEHERIDETQVYRKIASGMNGDDPLAAMSRTHQEIFHLARTFDHIVSEIGPEGPEPEDIVDLRRALYALHAVLRLNIAQEEELYVALDPEYAGAAVA